MRLHDPPGPSAPDPSARWAFDASADAPSADETANETAGGSARWTFDASAAPAPAPLAPSATPERDPRLGVGARMWRAVRRLFTGDASSPSADTPPPATHSPAPAPSAASPLAALASPSVAPSPLVPAGPAGPAGAAALPPVSHLPAVGAAWIARPRPDPAPVQAAPLPLGDASRVLLAEADPTTARVLRHRLEREGFEILVADDTTDALEVLAAGGIDLLLLDADLPGGALQVLRRLRRGHGDADLPVILLSWPGNDLVAVRAFGLGSDDVVTRPFSLSEVAARVRYQLQRGTEDRLAARIADRVESRIADRIENRLTEQLAEQIAGRVAERVADRLGLGTDR